MFESLPIILCLIAISNLYVIVSLIRLRSRINHLIVLIDNSVHEEEDSLEQLKKMIAKRHSKEELRKMAEKEELARIAGKAAVQNYTLLKGF